MHINELHKAEYPWRELFGLLKAEGYEGYTLAEIPDSPEPERLLRYYQRALAGADGSDPAGGTVLRWHGAARASDPDNRSFPTRPGTR